MEKLCCVTGHRNFPESKLDYVKAELRREVLDAINDGYTVFVSGFAQGVDLLFASIVLGMKTDFPALSLQAVLPYRGRLKTPDALFRKLILECRAVEIYSESYHPDCFLARNRAMVNQSQRVIAVYDGRGKGGTFYTLVYSKLHGRDVRVIRI